MLNNLLRDGLTKAMHSVYKARRNQIHDGPWGMKTKWVKLGKETFEKVLTQRFNLEPSRVFSKTHHRLNKWTALDTIVLKAIKEIFERSTSLLWGVEKNCVFSMKSSKTKKRGLKQMVQSVQSLTSNYKWVCKTDIADFYYTIDHKVVKDSLPAAMPGCVRKIVIDYCDRVEIVDGDYQHVKRGIANGGVLSPTIGNWYLKPLDKALVKLQGVVYRRYMDDLFVFTNSRRKLRKAIKLIHRYCEMLKLKLSKPKTFIGRTERGFSGLGYEFKPNQRLKPSEQCLSRMRDKALLLYEEVRRGWKMETRQQRQARVAQYLKRWWTWCKGGINGLLDQTTAMQCVLNALPVSLRCLGLTREMDGWLYL